MNIPQEANIVLDAKFKKDGKAEKSIRRYLKLNCTQHLLYFYRNSHISSRITCNSIRSKQSHHWFTNCCNCYCIELDYNGILYIYYESIL